ncbi:MAG: endonuclease/exonuclease/phosphatase family protein [Bacteroidota bacterium]|nr:endonuclease/exonuclease/phosphatase family protein [Bacteroidota bacterium]MDP4244271.1 endonuclease/exonuclease/phosphatase family protein [Bacteroidota bacterium]MDP4254511.1 endonuclease/exonuclease/phosphatase family protein [Bacteroidota bacterium]MDP4260670.1 endonuclease/exonuclease/phosphatase family protein [Bacteroidota bacterium]
MAFRNKAALILKYKPDILVVPECEHPDRLLFPPGTPKPKDQLWFGKNQHKGLAIFSYSRFRFSVFDDHNEDFKMIVPISVKGGRFDFNLFAIWANNPGDPDGQYITQIWKAIRYYDRWMANKGTLLVGDFNSNSIWDRPRRAGNHSNVVKLLEDKGIFSAYHLHYKQSQGKEKHPTLYMYRHKDKPYHIDYCFVSADLADSLRAVEIGSHRRWTKYSDHVPVMVTFDSRLRNRPGNG